MNREQMANTWQYATPVRIGAPAAERPPKRRRMDAVIPLGGVFGVVATACIVLVALLGPAIVGTDPAQQNLPARLSAPFGFGGSLDHPLGTDALGRDLLARVVAGARLSLLIGLIATLGAGTLGVVLGLVAGFGGGAGDRIVTWGTDVQLAVPFVIVAIAITAVLGNGITNVVIALAVTGWVGYAKVVRLQAKSLRAAPWIDAARSLGASPTRIAVRHVLPNLAGPIVILATQQVGGMILYEAALSYLGLGVGGNSVSWGGMVADGQEVVAMAWWVSAVPGAAIATTILGLNAAGDWLSASNRS
ncbi:MAG: ABC transporter permease [Chloroflexota bacterium]|nr:ABC transporter permease [Chloroflexota bacterium]